MQVSIYKSAILLDLQNHSMFANECLFLHSKLMHNICLGFSNSHQIIVNLDIMDYIMNSCNKEKNDQMLKLYDTTQWTKT